MVGDMLWPFLFAAMTDAQIELAIKRAPADVRAVIERRQGCNHWVGEEPYDKDRARQIDEAIRQLHCVRIDRDVATMRRRYKARPALVRLLDRTADWGY